MVHGPWTNYQLPSYLCGMKILMVCLGNICRSPLAEGILQRKAADAGLNWTIESAGTNAYHTGEAPHQLSQKVAKQNGLDISCQVATRFSPDDFDRYDKIYAMANDVLADMRRMSGAKFDKEKTDLFLNVLQPGENRDVPDPWFGEEAGYHEVFALIDTTCNRIVENYLANQQRPTSA